MPCFFIRRYFLYSRTSVNTTVILFRKIVDLSINKRVWFFSV